MWHEKITISRHSVSVRSISIFLFVQYNIEGHEFSIDEEWWQPAGGASDSVCWGHVTSERCPGSTQLVRWWDGVHDFLSHGTQSCSNQSTVGQCSLCDSEETFHSSFHLMTLDESVTHIFLWAECCESESVSYKPVHTLTFKGTADTSST